MSPAKRVMDVVVSLVVLVVAAPVLLVASLCIWLADFGPPFFVQERIGRGGRPFRMFKLRTMTIGAEQRGRGLTVAGDDRVTRWGRWLRRTKIDELPQLLNVLLGHMSLVGPRPEIPAYVARYGTAEAPVLAFAPGLTDPASIAYVDEERLLAAAADPEATYVATVLPEKIRRSLEYARTATVWSDLRVLAATIGVVARHTRGPAPGGPPIVFRNRRLVIVLTYAVLVPLGYLGAFLLRFDFAVPPDVLPVLLPTLPVVIVARLATYWHLRLFQGYWQHFGLYDLLRVARATTVSSVVIALVLWAAGYIGPVPRSVIVLDWILAIMLVGGVHFTARCAREGGLPLRRRPAGRRTLVIGAGEAAARIVRLFHEDVDARIRVVGLLDDATEKRGLLLHGVPVLGSTDRLDDIVARHAIELLVIAMPSATPEQKRRVTQQCMATGVEFRVVRPRQELVDGKPPQHALRPVEVEDLLGRTPVHLDPTAIREEIRGKVVLVTGAAGSIGAELARQVAERGPARLVLVEHAETPLFFTQMELARSHPALPITAIVLSITEEARLRRVFAEHRPSLVLHAAAYKHVPMMEENVLAAVRNNVLGTLAVARCAATCGCRKFVLLSTDKAVNPSSVMGATKRIAERLVLGLAELRASGTDFRAVRFGNVLGSAGSVIPLFRMQLARGRPLTVTHPDVTRYFMTVQEAVQLVLQSVTLPEARGRIAMLEMGEPMRIVELAENLIRLSGQEPYADVRISFTGLRPGEKLQEDLVSALEAGVPTRIEKIRVVRRESVETFSSAELQLLASAVSSGNTQRVLAVIGRLVLECVPPLRGRVADVRRSAAAMPVRAPDPLGPPPPLAPVPPRVPLDGASSNGHHIHPSTYP
jgi:FlaA1/EpsC-like NDP-sugar epimerase/lipopolysaccharide/colanic/teichoic acid biosynthesis glycosyltransferase